jgi:hypothetical protein
MALHEETLQQQYITLIEAYYAEFPSIEPPAPEWWMLWLDKYSFGDLQAVIQSLGRHPLKARFTSESTGKAIAAKLREIALRRAVSFTPKTGVRGHE